MCAENQKCFEEFVDYCSKLTVEHPEVIAFLQSRFSKANPTYLSSVEFRNTLGRCLTRVQGKQTKVYVYINELCTVLKNNSEKKKVNLQVAVAAAGPQADKVETEQPAEDAEEEVPERKAGSKHQIRRLENLLRLYSQEIQKLQEKELSIEDMDDEDSTYIQESRLKQKMLRIFEKLCELKTCSSLTGRVIEQRIRYQGTRYKEVNRRLEKFINKTRDIFPDYNDVLQEVQKASDRHNLDLTRKQVRSIAQDAFRDLGNKLQHRRHLDMVYNFGCHLTDSYKSGLDPAEQDSSLARRLRENRSLAENQLEDVIKKYAELQDEGEDEDWKNKNQDNELPSTSKDVKLQDSPRSRKSQSEEDEEDEESEESDVDIEEELRQSQEVADGEEDEEVPVDYLNETDQKMEGASSPMNSSPAGKEDEEEESDNSDQTGDDVIEEGTDKDEDQELSSGITSLSPEKEDLNASLELEADAADPASSGHSNDGQLANNSQEDHAEPEKDTLTSPAPSDESDSGNHTMEQLEMSVVEEDFIGGYNTEVENVPYVEAKVSSSKEQGTSKHTDTTDDLVKDPKSLTGKWKDGKTSRLDKCISKITGSLADKVPIKSQAAPSLASGRQRFRHHRKPSLGGSSRTQEQSSNLKLVCVNTPTQSWDSVRKVAFSHGQSADEKSDVVHLDSCKNSTRGDASNGVHRAMVMSATPVNRLKRKRDTNSSTDSLCTVRVEELGAHRRKRKPSPQIWTGNGVTRYNGAENGKQQKLKISNLSR
ncbi:PREDICTED: death domain-associated protein 6 [Nanorana parkeri]|uniref:death domain-associated protein 6 n=1 Tax=Nanorana parkeri TaxID=125878 RepID=UPI000854BF28|nr:PREDICTED: death domain-associated protein 6 [Nanorana parkeri]